MKSVLCQQILARFEAVRLGWLGWLAPPFLAWAGGIRGAARARGRERWDADILRVGAPLNFFPQKNCPDTEKVLKCGGRIRIMGLMEGLVMDEVVIGIDTALGSGYPGGAARCGRDDPRAQRW